MFVGAQRSLATLLLACRAPPPLLSTAANDARSASADTIEDYAAVAKAAGPDYDWPRSFTVGNNDEDVLLNIDALLGALPDGPCDILDVACGPGRDLATFASRGHRAIGLDGVAAFCEMARARSGCEVWEQDLGALDLPDAAFDGVFCNACLFHVPRAALPATLASLRRALRPDGALFVSNAHGFGKDQEGFLAGRTASTRSYGCYLSEATWIATCEAAGFQLVESSYRPLGKPPEEQPYLTTLWRRTGG